MVSTDGMKDEGTPASGENLLVKSSDGQDITIRYEFEQTPNDPTRQDVTSCLAAIFDQMKIDNAIEPNEASY